MALNPYAPPTADLSRRAEDPDYPGVWRHGSVLVVERQAVLPTACIRCNGIGVAQLKRKLYWHHPAVYIALVLNLIIYVILAMVLRKKATVEIGLCRRHHNRRRIVLMTGSALVLLGLGGCSAGIALEQGIFGLGALVALAGMIVVVVGERVVWPTKIDHQHVWLKGCGSEYLERFPPFIVGS